MNVKSYCENVKVQTTTCYIEAALDHFNERVRIDFYTGRVQDVICQTETWAELYQYTKLIIKARQEHLYTLLHAGYMLEAVVDGYFQGSDALFMTKYDSQSRRNSLYWDKGDEIVAAVQQNIAKEKIVPPTYTMRLADEKDAVQLAVLYGTVFEVYPTPLNEAEYVKKTMKEGTLYRVYEHEGVIVSAASAEVDAAQRNAELTNCATLPEHRKYGLMKELLKSIEDDLRMEGIYCAYTIARTLSYGMNAAFFQLGYAYRGRLTNNCYIFDKLEDMNVWTKDLSQ